MAVEYLAETANQASPTAFQRSLPASSPARWWSSVGHLWYPNHLTVTTTSRSALAVDGRYTARRTWGRTSSVV